MNIWFGFVFGIVCTFAVCADNFFYGIAAHDVINKCEQTLPRNQHCELVAVPVDRVEE